MCMLTVQAQIIGIEVWLGSHILPSCLKQRGEAEVYNMLQV